MNDFLFDDCSCQGCDTCDAGCDTCNSCEGTTMDNNDLCINHCDGCDSGPCESACQNCQTCQDACLLNACQSCQNVCESICQDNLDSCDNRQDCISYQECSTCDTCDACMTLCQEGDSGCTEVIPCNESSCSDAPCNESSCNDCVSGQTNPPCNQETPTPCTCQSAQVDCCSENVDSPDCDNCEYVQGGGTEGCSSIQNSESPSVCKEGQDIIGPEGSSSGCGQSIGSGDIPVITPTSPNTEGWLRVNNQRFSPYTTWEKIQPKISDNNKDAKLINYHRGNLDSLELLLDGSIIFIYD